MKTNIALDLINQGLFDKALETLKEGIYEGIVSSMQSTISEAATAAARDLANTAAQSLLNDLTTSQLRTMGETIATAFEEGKRPADIYKKLRQVQDLDKNRIKRLDMYEQYLRNKGLKEDEIAKKVAAQKERLLNERRKTIAKTEGNKANGMARLTEAEDRGYEYKCWVTSGDDRVSEECAGNEEDGVIPIDEPFSSGVMQNPGHPNCRCTVKYLPRKSAVAEKLQERNIAKTQQAKEDAKKSKKNDEEE